MTPSEHNPQSELGAFKRYARIITLSDLDLPSPSIYEHDCLANFVSECLAGDVIDDHYCCALVGKGHNILGYVNWEDLFDDSDDETLQVSECMNKFHEKQILGPHTSIFDTYTFFEQHPSEVCFVTKDGQPNALLDACLLHNSTGMKICLYAMLTSLERSILRLMQFYHHESLSHLQPPYLYDAIELYDRKHLRKLSDGTHYTHHLLGCTTLTTKLYIVRKLSCLTNKIALDRNFIYLVTNLRNFLAHPEEDNEMLRRGNEELLNACISIITATDEIVNKVLKTALDNRPPFNLDDFITQ